MISISLFIDEDYAFGIMSWKARIKDGPLFNAILIGAFIINLYEIVILNSSSMS